MERTAAPNAPHDHTASPWLTTSKCQPARCARRAPRTVHRGTRSGPPPHRAHTCKWRELLKFTSTVAYGGVVGLGDIRPSWRVEQPAVGAAARRADRSGAAGRETDVPVPTR